MQRWLLVTVMIMAVMLSGVGAEAQDMDELEVDHNVNSEFVTPHTKWAQPYALGKTRALFFVRGHGVLPREVIELKQRFDLDPQMVFWARIVDSSQEQWHGAENGVRRMMRLLGQKWDVFVFLGIKPELMPVEAQYLLFKQVTDGAGLVLVGTEEKRVIKAKNRLAEAPPFLAEGPVGEAYSIMKGRGIMLPAQPNIPYAVGWEVAYDYWQQRLGRAVLWAAGKAPRLELAATPRAPEVTRASLPGVVAKVTWKATGAVPATTLIATLRHPDGQRTSLPPIPARSAEGQAEITLPPVPAGAYHLDVSARGPSGIEAFASAEFAVTSPRRVAEVVLDRSWAEISEKLSGQVKLEGAAAANERLLVSLRDHRGRELMRQDRGRVATGGDFSFTVPAWLPMLLRVEARLMQGEAEIANAYTYARVTKRHRDQFNFVMWDTPKGTLGPYGQEALANAGVTAQLTHGNPEPYIAAFDVAWVPYTTRILNALDANGVTKPACWHDEEKIQAHVDAIVAKHEPSRQHGVFVYSLGDEGDVRGSCVSPHCLQAYRKYLAREYGPIAALNASWGTAYQSFDDVQLSQPEDNKEAAALQAGNFPRWYDRQAFQSDSFCQLCERFGQAFQQLDPQSKCGFEGAGRFQDGDDLDGFVRSNTFWSPYPGTADEVVRSIAPREFPRSNWLGYTKDADSLLQKYWRMVTRGCDSVWWWRWDCIGRFHGWIAPSLDPFPAVKEIIADTRIVREGLGDVLLRCEMLDDGVGMLYSQPSAYAAKIQGSDTYASYEGAHVAWHNNLRDLGLQFRYVTDRQLRLGEFKPDQFKVMILPFIQALGPQEAKVLREFVAAGGTLLADVRPGVYDGHCKPLAAGVLDEVFGLQREASSPAALAEGTVKVTAGGVTAEVALTGLKVDRAVRLAGATAGGKAGETPLLLVNKFGKGQAILLNFPLSSYPLLSSPGTSEAAAEVLAGVLALGEVRPAVQLHNAAGQRVRNVEVTRWRNGNDEVVSVFRHFGAAEPARITFTRDVQVADLKARRDLGRGRSFPLTITPYRAVMLAACEQAPVALEVTADRATLSRGQQLTVKVTAPRARGQRGVWLQVKQPDGTPAAWLDRVVVTDRRGAEVTLPLAYNDPAGVWTVTATDLLPTTPATCRFTAK